ncbi:hypothetical protein HDU97_004701 [Phlyctochytrium planicorne]|nr:hypothetical protein HDU97_004701 [Phlyctochytrium planicorne]
MSAVAGSSADMRTFLPLRNYFTRNSPIPVGLDLGYKILSLSPQNISSYTFLTTGTFNATNSTTPSDTRYMDYATTAAKMFNDIEKHLDSGWVWNASVPWAPSNFDMNAEPKAFVCGGQLLVGSTELVTSCFVDATTCRSGTIQQDLFLRGHAQAGIVPTAPLLDKVAFRNPAPPEPLLHSFALVLQYAMQKIIRWEERFWKRPNFNLLADFDVSMGLDPSKLLEIDSLISRNASFQDIVDKVIEYAWSTDNEEKIAVSISNVEAHYGLLSLATLGLADLPVEMLDPTGSHPVLAATPFIIEDSAGYNWTAHSAACHHETLLCDAKVANGVVINTWNCILVPIYCNSDYLPVCDDALGIGPLWATEDSLVQAIDSVKRALLHTQPDPYLPDYQNWNMAWRISPEENGVVQSRLILERSLGLLHFAWAMSTMPFAFDASSSNDQLISLQALRSFKSSQTAVAIDLLVSFILLGCLAISILGGLFSLFKNLNRNQTNRFKRASWDPVDFIRNASDEAPIVK